MLNYLLPDHLAVYAGVFFETEIAGWRGQGLVYLDRLLAFTAVIHVTIWHTFL